MSLSFFKTFKDEEGFLDCLESMIGALVNLMLATYVHMHACTLLQTC